MKPGNLSPDQTSSGKKNATPGSLGSYQFKFSPVQTLPGNREAIGKEREIQFSMFPETVTADQFDQNNNGSPPNSRFPTTRVPKKKRVIIMKKQYVDENGLLLQDKKESLKKRSQAQIINNLDLVAKQPPSKFTSFSGAANIQTKAAKGKVTFDRSSFAGQPDNSSLAPLSSGRLEEKKKKSTLGNFTPIMRMPGPDESSVSGGFTPISFGLGGRIQIPGGGPQEMMRKSKKNVKMKTSKAPEENPTETARSRAEAEKEVDKFLLPKKDPYDRSQMYGLEPPVHGPVKEKLSGNIIPRSMIGNQALLQEAQKIKEKKKLEEKERLSRNSVQRSRQRSVSQRKKSSTSNYMMNSNSSTQQGFGKLNSFGLRTKQKKLKMKHKDLSDQQYQDLCFEVTRRIRKNQAEQASEYESMFAKTIKAEGDRAVKPTFSGVHKLKFHSPMIGSPLQGSPRTGPPVRDDLSEEEKRQQTQMQFNQFIHPAALIEERSKLNTQQIQRLKFKIEAVDRPLNRKEAPLQLQLKETRHQRQLGNYERYQKLWDNYEEQVEAHFVRQEEIKKGRAFGSKEGAFQESDIQANSPTAQDQGHNWESLNTSERGANCNSQAKATSEILIPDDEEGRRASHGYVVDSTSKVPAFISDLNTIQVGRGTMIESGRLTSKRTSIINQGDIYNSRNVEKEAIRAATFDVKSSIPVQVWYDSLRETDDGRFSVVEHHSLSPSKQQQLMTKTSRFRSKILKNYSLSARQSIFLPPPEQQAANVMALRKQSEQVPASMKAEVMSARNPGQFPKATSAIVSPRFSQPATSRPFNSTNRVNYEKMKNQPLGHLFTSKKVFPPTIRTGGPTGHEMLAEQPLPKKKEKPKTSEGGSSSRRYPIGEIGHRAEGNDQKFVINTQVFGKPTVLIKNNPQHKGLKTDANQDENVNSLVRQQEDDQQRVAEVQRYFDRVDRENLEENEYNRTEINEHHLTAAQPKTVVPDLHNDQLRIYQKIDCTGRESSYVNKLKKGQNKQISRVLNGMKDIHDLCFLRVKGINQFEKEVSEIKNIPNKVIDMNALHRNEVTHEVEGTNPSIGPTRDSPKKNAERFESPKTPHITFNQLKQSDKAAMDRRSVLSYNTMAFNRSYSSSSEEMSPPGARRKSIVPRIPKPRVNYQTLQVNEMVEVQMDPEELV